MQVSLQNTSMCSHSRLPTFRRVFYACSLLFLSTSFLSAQVFINEVCSSNQNIIQDAFGDTPDWIELYNAGDEVFDLEGWYLSDNENELDKWQFPIIALPAKSFVLIFASGNDIEVNYVHTNFKLAKEGEVLILSNPDLEMVDQIVIPPLETDHSFGRNNDGGATWAYFQDPTPAKSNSEGVLIGKSAVPQFSIPKNFHQKLIFLFISCEDPGCEIRYSLDGSVPNENSLLYQNPITIDTTTVVRAVAFAPNLVPSFVKTQSYFIAEQHVLPVFSITSEPANFFDWDNGIFRTGPDASPDWPFWGANYWKDIKIPVHVEFFEEDRSSKLVFDCAAKTHGGRGARTWPQKPLRLLAEQQYGIDKFEFPFFDHKVVESFERLVLRNSSGDFNRTHFRSGFLSQKVINDGLDIDALAYRPTVLYINGSYWGVINLREKGDEYYMESNYGISPSELDVLEESDQIVIGDFDVFDQHYDFVVNEDMSVQTSYDMASSFFDISSLVDYFATQTIYTNTDWPQNNIKFWRQKSPDGKWRYILFDLDTSTGNNTWNTADFNVFRGKMEQFADTNKHINLLSSFLENEGFRNYFLNRYADLLNTSFRPEIFSAEVQAQKELLRPEMPRHFERWDFCSLCRSFEEWDSRHTLNFIEFAENRAPYAREHLIDYFELDNEVHLELQTYPPNAGKIEINTITPKDLPWDGWYFNGVPVTLTVHPNPGFTFSHWQSLESIPLPDENQSITYNFEKDDAITAYFTNTYEPAFLKIAPNPAKDLVRAHFETAKIEMVDISLYNAKGQALFENHKTYNAGIHEIEIPLKGLAQGVYFLKIETAEKVEVGKVLLQKD